DRRMCNQALPVVTDMRALLPKRGIERRCAVRGGIPSHALEIGAHVAWGEVGDTHELDAGCMRHLREVHAAELSRADQSDTERPVLRLPLLEETVEIQEAFSFLAA